MCQCGTSGCSGCGKIIVPTGQMGAPGAKGDKGDTGDTGPAGANGSCVVLGAGVIETVTPQTLLVGTTVVTTLTNSLPAGSFIVQFEATFNSDIALHNGTIGCYVDGVLESNSVRPYGSYGSADLSQIDYKVSCSHALALASPGTITWRVINALGTVILKAGSYTYIRTL